jgi:transketolase
MRDIFIGRLMEHAASDPRIMLVTGDLGFGVLTEFERRFPRQYLNVGVAEQNMTGVATGLALEGRTVFTYSIANFPTLRCLEQIRNDAAYHCANVKIVAIGGGFSYGQLGMSHHATEDLAILRAIPGITVVSPGDDWEAAEATSAVIAAPGTCYLRIDKSSAGNRCGADERFVIGRARRVREGEDATIIATGGILGVALEAADRLSGEGIEARVISAHTLKPFDADAVVAAARETGGLVTLEEHGIEGGLGSAVAEACMDAGVAPRGFARLAVRGGFACAVGDQPYLRTRYSLDESAVCSAVHSIVRRGSHEKN